MNQARRQPIKRLLLLLLVAAGLILTLVGRPSLGQLQTSKLGPQIQHFGKLTQTTSNKQYHQGSSNNFLVNAGIDQDASSQQMFALSLALSRQQQPSDLDNVIESTTSQLPVLPKIVSYSSSCQLPPTWAGKWFQSNKEPIRVTNTEISDKGLCRDQKGDKYLFENNFASANNNKPPQQQSTPCLTCLVINERHLNVLQYKESSCQPIPAGYYNRSSNTLFDDHKLLESICSDITGDAQLESLFRLETPAIECPISGQFSFSYDMCRSPQSSLDSCIDKKQLNFKFSACPDIAGSESKFEVLKCYADWSEGSNYYMIGRLEHASNQLDKGKFRCFLYEKSPDGKIISMAQTLEENCYGLLSATEGPKTFRLTAKPPTAHKCHFPSYIQSQSENWLSVDNSLIYMFNQNSTKYQVKETKEGNIIEEATCLQQFAHFQAHSAHFHHQHPRSNDQPQQISTNRRSLSSSYHSQADHQQATSRSNDVVYLVQITKNCHTTNYCVRFHKRSNGIVQIDYFINSPNSDNQCRNAYVGTPETQIITSTNLEHQRCPFDGVYTIEAPIESDLTYNPSNIFICPRQSFLTAQCDHPSRLRIHSKCSHAKFSFKNLYCLGTWTTNGLVRLLLTDDDRQRFTAWYRDYATFPTANQDGALGDSPQALALQQQQFAITRSQQLISASNSQYNPVSTIVDLQIALITPLPIVAKPMQVRLTRRNQCSDLRGYLSQGIFGLSMPAGSSSLPSYASPAVASSSAPNSPNYTHSSILILIVTLLMFHLSRDTATAAYIRAP